MRAVPWPRRVAANVLILLWNAWGALAYLLKRRRERSRVFRRFCRENGLEPPPGSERELHRFSRHHERSQAALVIGGLLKDLTKLDRVCRGFRIVGGEVLESCRDRGALVVGFHVGPFSLVGPLLTRMGFDTTVLIRGDELTAATGRELAEVNRVLADRFSGEGLGSAQLVDSQAMLSLIQIKKALKRKGLVLVYPDTAKSSSVGWAPIRFFRQQLAGHLGLAKLLQMTRAQVLHLVTYWDEDGTMVLEVLPCPYEAEGPPEGLLHAIYAPFEGLVARRPSQWVQVHSYDELKFDSSLADAAPGLGPAG